MAYRAGERVAAGELVASMLQAMEGRTVQIVIVGEDPVVCRSASSGGAWSILRPAAGVPEVRVIQQTAYLKESGGWAMVDLTDEGRTVASQAMADALNRTLELLPGDCRWNERLAAIDPAGTAVVKATTGDEVTLSIPTDPESQGDKSSMSERTYAQATWVLGRDGAPRRYRAPDGSRVFTFSLSNDPIEAPPAEGTQPG
jgi:hypothetical protein